MKRILVFVAALAVLILPFAGCTSSTPPTNTTTATTPPADINLGAVMDSTGALSGIGPALVNTINMAVSDFNAAGGANGAKVVLYVEDGKTDPTAGFDAIKKLATINNCKVIIGPMISGAVLASGQWAADNKVLLFSPSATSPDIAHQAWRAFFFRTAAIDSVQGQAMAQYIIEKGYKKVDILVQNTQYGTGLGDAVVAALGTKATVVRYQKYDPIKLDYLTELGLVKNDNVDCVVHVGYEDDAQVVFKQAAQLGLDNLHWITSEGVKADATLADPQAAAFMAKCVVGTNPVAPPTSAAANAAFAAKYKAKYNADPGTYCAEVYDATNLVLQAFKNVGGTDATKVATEVLRLAKNYAGVSGTITLDQYGDRTSASYEIWNVVLSGTTYKYGQVEIINL